MLADVKSGWGLVQDYRALGAPIALEVADDRLVQWTVGKDQSATHQIAEYSLDALPELFKKHSDDWTPQELFRAKNISFQPRERQIEMFANDLIPEIESRIKAKLALKPARSRGSKGNNREKCRVFQAQVVLALVRQRAPENDIAQLPIPPKMP